VKNIQYMGLCNVMWHNTELMKLHTLYMCRLSYHTHTYTQENYTDDDNIIIINIKDWTL